jgi:cobalt/nickel transport system permease protein
MHIPDGFISVPVAVGTGLVSVAGLALALGRVEKSLGVESAPILGLTTAFIFAAQMINFPVTAGTSGHLLGGTLAAIILGSPWGAMLCIATVLIIQAVLFADGGITALGANILNMAIISVWVGWGLSQTIRRMLTGRMGLVVSTSVAAGISLVVASVACGIELSISGTASPQVVLPAMTGIHILIGVGEGLITGGVLSYLANVRPDLLPGEQGKIRGWLVPLVIIFLVAGVLSLFASTWPDGLDSVAEKLQFYKLAENVRVSLPTPFADYSFPGLNKIGTSIAGIIGSIVCFAVAFSIAKVVKGVES